jgi:hypothetical protein
MIDMRRLMIVLTAVAPLMVSGWAEAGERDPGLDFIKHKHPNAGQDYYVVRKGESGSALSSLAALTASPRVRLAMPHMQIKIMQRLRSNPLPNAKAG